MPLLADLFRGALSLGIPAPPERKDSRARERLRASAVQYGADYGITPPQSVADYEKLYASLVSVYRCVWVRAKSVAQGELRFYRKGRGDERVELPPTSPTVQFFRRPNPKTNGRLFLEQWVAYNDLAGDSYRELVPLASDAIAEAWHMRSSRVQVKPGGGYAHTVDGTPQHFDAELVHHDLYWSPINDWYGQAPTVPATDSLVADELAEKVHNAVLKNSARVSGIYSLEPDTTEEQAAAEVERFKEAMTGSENAGKIAFIRGGRKFEPITLSPSELNTYAGRQWNADQVRTVYGVPMIVYTMQHGDTSMTRENATVQWADFYRGTVSLLGQHITEEITHGLLPMLKIPDSADGDVVAELDYSDVAVFREEQHDRAQAHNLWVRAGILAPNEVRTQLGFEPLEGLDVPQLHTERGEVTATDDSKVLAIASARETAPMWHWRTVASALETTAQALETLVAKKPAMPALSDALDLPDDHELLEALESVFGQSVKLAGDQAIAQLALDLTFDAGTDSIREYLAEHTASFFAHTSETTQGLLLDSLTDGIDEGETMQALADRIKDVIGDRKGSALRGARTATTASTNKGGMEAFTQAGLQHHRWRTARDAHVRDSHQGLENQKRPIGESFSNGLTYPGDPSGPPSETANCRCFLTAVVPERRAFEEEDEIAKRYGELDAIHERQSAKVAKAFKAILDYQERRVLAALRRGKAGGGA